MAECPGIHKLAEMKDGLLARLRVPGGILTAEQAEHIATAAEKFGNGVIDLTNRSNLQLRGIKPKHQLALIDYLISHNLVTKDPVHDRLRNITIDPLSGLVDEIIDCTSLAHELDEALIKLVDKQSFSPKMAFVLDGGGPTKISNISHDFAFVAVESDPSGDRPAPFFRLLICGYETGIKIQPENLITTVLETLAKLKPYKIQAATLAEDKNPTLRMKSLLAEIGVDAIINRIGVPKASGTDQSYTQVKPAKQTIICPPPVIPMKSAQPSKKSTSNKSSENEQKVALNLVSPTARLRSFHLKGLAELAKTHGNGQIRLTSWQGIILPLISEEDISDVWEKAEAMALLTQQSEQNLKIISCSGSEGCIHGGYETKLNALKIREELAEMETIKPVTIHLSACEKGCATRAKTNYLFLQKRGSDQLTLHINADPSTKEKGKAIKEHQMAAELKKLI